MKKTFMLLAGTILALANIYLLDHSYLRADEGGSNGAAIAIPPTSPQAERISDGTAIIDYSPDDENSGAADRISTAAQNGKIDKLPGLGPDQIVAVTVTAGVNKAGHRFDAIALDGGHIFDAENGLVADEVGVVRFKFQAGHKPGLYQIALSEGGHEIGIPFWVIDTDRPEGNPKVDVPPAHETQP